MLVFTTDKHRLQKHFLKDPILFAYHLGDLDPFHFPNCQWAAVYGNSRYIADVILLYSAANQNTVMIFGQTDEMTHAVEEIRDLLPARFFCHFNRPSYAQQLALLYKERTFGTFQKMQLQQLSKPSSELTGIVRLSDSAESELLSFYREAYPSGYFNAEMLRTGKYFGCRRDGKVVAVAGIHVYSPEYKVGVIGNVAVHPDFRGNGLGGAVTYRLAAELSEEGLMVTLNVNSANHAAIRCYANIGFIKTHDYWESEFVRN